MWHDLIRGTSNTSTDGQQCDSGHSSKFKSGLVLLNLSELVTTGTCAQTYIGTPETSEVVLIKMDLYHSEAFNLHFVLREEQNFPLILWHNHSNHENVERQYKGAKFCDIYLTYSCQSLN